MVKDIYGDKILNWYLSILLSCTIKMKKILLLNAEKVDVKYFTEKHLVDGIFFTTEYHLILKIHPNMNTILLGYLCLFNILDTTKTSSNTSHSRINSAAQI